MSNLDNERDMWDAIVTTARADDERDRGGLVTTQTARTKRGETVVILTDRMVEATKHDGLVATTDGETVQWFTLGKPFRRNGTQVRYGYLRFDRGVVTERDRQRRQQAWYDANR